MLAQFSSLNILTDRELIGCEDVGGRSLLVFQKNKRLRLACASMPDSGACIECFVTYGLAALNYFRQARSAQ